MPQKAAVRILACISLVFLILLAIGCATVPEPPPVQSSYPPAPDVPFVHMDGSTTTIETYARKSVLLVNFWGLRCQNCIEEMPFLERLHHKYGGKGLVILGINTDGVDGPLLEKFLPQLPVKITYPIVVDPEFTLADGYEMMAAPLTVVIARDGTVRMRHEGYTPEIEGEYVTLIEQLLAE